MQADPTRPQLRVRSFADRRLRRHAVVLAEANLVVDLDDGTALGPHPAPAFDLVVGLADADLDTPSSAGDGVGDVARLPGVVLDAFLDALGGGDRHRAATLLSAVDDDVAALRILHGLALGRIRAWSVERVEATTTGSGDGPPRPSRQLVVLQSSGGGRWACSDGERFAPATAEQVTGRLALVVGPAPPHPPVATVTPCPSCRRWRPSAASSSPG